MKTYKVPESTHNGLEPRERAMEYGLDRLSDLDLMQILLGTGTRGQPVRQLAARVLTALDASPGLPDPVLLKDIRGIGTAKATVLCAAVEFSRRLFMTERSRIRQPQDVWNLIRHYADRPQETFLCIQLNGACEAVQVELISLGLLNRTLVHPREVFAGAVANRAASIMVAHNHPSGHLEPSSDDIEITRRLVESGKTLGIPVMDHLIFCPEHFWSFMEHGLI